VAMDVLENISRFDAATVLSLDGYHHDLPAFMDMLDTLEAHAIPVINAASLVQWNCTKAYLKELERKGCHTLPTLWLEQGESIALLKEMNDSKWPEAIAKPLSSAGAHETRRI